MTMEIDDLARAIRERQAILFAGAGISAGLGAPTWSGLMGRIGEELEFDPDVFARPGVSYLTLAEYYKIQKSSIGSLRSWMDNHFNASEEALRASIVHRLILDLDFPIIYTTNYDRNIENFYRFNSRAFRKIADVYDISKVRDGETQIIKLHGDFDNDESIVLTETQYFDRLSFESPLDIKLRADALGKTILFVGYSLNDINIRLLLYKLWRTWTDSGHGERRPKSYIFLSRPDPIQEAVLAKWGIISLSYEADDPGTALNKFLAELIEKTQIDTVAIT